MKKSIKKLRKEVKVLKSKIDKIENEIDFTKVRLVGINETFRTVKSKESFLKNYQNMKKIDKIFTLSIMIDLLDLDLNSFVISRLTPEFRSNIPNILQNELLDDLLKFEENITNFDKFTLYDFNTKKSEFFALLN